MTETNKVFKGAILTVTMRWTDRIIGLVSTVILARLLAPEDFGIVAMAMIVVGFIDVLLSLGVNQALIYNKEATRQDFDTAWTIRFIQASFTSLLVFFAAPAAAQYFETPLLIDVLRVMCFTILFGAIENIGVVNFVKNMDFGRDFAFMFSKRFAAFIVTIALAYSLRSYWALVLGTLIGKVFGVVLSYFMHSYRPRFSLEKFSEIWSFSQWILVKNIGAYFDTTMDRVLVGRRLDANALGGYTIAGEVSSLPTTELLAPLGRVLFPALVEKRDNIAEFRSRLNLAIGVQCMAAFPACIGLIYVAEDLVPLLLGPKWLFVVPILQIMAIANLFGALSHSTSYSLLAMGKVKIQALVFWVQTLLFVGLVYASSKEINAQGFASIRAICVLMGSFFLLTITIVQLQVLNWSGLFSSLWRPLIATSMMALMLTSIQAFLIDIDLMVRLSLEVVVGAMTYFLAVTICWLLVRMPEGAESYLFKNLGLAKKV